MNTSEGNASRWTTTAPPLQTESRAGRWMWAAYGALLFLYACVAINLPVIAIPEAAVDDGLYVRGAINILKGDWLGPYDNLTLSKGPFYSIWIAAISYTGLPILFVQALLYGGSCLALARAVRVWLRSEAATFFFFVFLLLSPIPVSEGQLRIMREGIYGPMTILIVASCIWWFRLKGRSLVRRALLALGLGLLIGCYWATREESAIILPTLLATLCVLLRSAWIDSDRNRSLFREAVLAVVTLGVAVGLYAGFRKINQDVYGVPDVVEFKQKEFIAAYSALARIQHHDLLRYVIVPHEALDRSFGVSSAAAKLQPYFQHPGYVEAGCAAYEVVPCDGEVHGAWFMWALRDAVATSGYYTTAVQARGFYTSLAREINEACEAGRIACDARRDSMVPRFSGADVVKTVRRAGEILRFMATLDSVEPGNWGKPHSCYFDDCGAGSLYRDFLDVTNTSLYAHASWIVPPFTAPGDRKPDGAKTSAQTRSVAVSTGLNTLASGYRTVLPALCIIAAICYLVSLAIAARERSLDAMTALSGIALITLLIRVLFLAFLDAVAGMPSVNTLYLSPVYPFLLMFCFLSIASAVMRFGQARRAVATHGSRHVEETAPPLSIREAHANR